MRRLISIIIPTLNEEKYICQCIGSVLRQSSTNSYEIIVSDGGSRDGTLEVVPKSVCRFITKPGRSIQLNGGVKMAKGDIYLFLHAHNQLPANALEVIFKTVFEEHFEGGASSNQFSEQNDKIKRIGRFVNISISNIDEDPCNTFFCGDNGIFAKSEVFHALGGFRNLPIMEDIDFSKRMAKQYRCKRITCPKIITSSRRLVQHGIWRTQIEWMLINKLFHVGFSPQLLNRFYRRYKLMNTEVV